MTPDWTVPQYHPYRGNGTCPRCSGHRLAVQHQGYEGGRRQWMATPKPSRTRERIEVGIFLVLFLLGLFAAALIPVDQPTREGLDGSSTSSLSRAD